MLRVSATLKWFSLFQFFLTQYGLLLPLVFIWRLAWSNVPAYVLVSDILVIWTLRKALNPSQWPLRAVFPKLGDWTLWGGSKMISCDQFAIAVFSHNCLKFYNIPVKNLFLYIIM